MRALFVAAVCAALVFSLPASAAHWHVYPSFGFSLGSGPYGPWYGPRVGVGVHVGGPYHPAYPGPGPAPGPATSQPPAPQGALKLYVYPAAGQSEAQTADDRYQCHTWATGQSGHDPTLGAGTREEAESYSRAFTACMEGRNYVVR